LEVWHPVARGAAHLFAKSPLETLHDLSFILLKCSLIRSLIMKRVEGALPSKVNGEIRRPDRYATTFKKKRSAFSAEDDKSEGEEDITTIYVSASSSSS
jgi:hypothetical protein